MTPLAIAIDAFLQARIGTCQFPDGSAHNTVAMWWRRTLPTTGATWSLEFVDTSAGGPAVVDDFGDLVLAEVRS